MTDLAAWLLDAIAEGEAPTFELVPYSCEPGCCAPAGWVGHRCFVCGTTEFGGTVEAITDIARDHEDRIHAHARVLAECAAKRAVIAACTKITDAGWWEYDDAPDLAELVLANLAAPYRDREGWREEWATTSP